MIIKLKRAVLCWLGLHYDVEYTYDVWGMWDRCRDCYKPTGYWPCGGSWADNNEEKS